MSETNQATGTGSRPLWSRRWFWLGGGLLAGAAALVSFAPRAWAFRAMGGGFAGHGFGGRHAFGGQLLKDPARAKEHAALATEFVLRGVNASEEQKQKARQISDRLVDQLGPLAQKHRALHQALVAEFAKPQIDREAIEKLRRQGMGLADEATKTALASIEDLGDVLTPEQRTDLIELARRFHGEGPLD
jgi:Spy/CpxP family protein refolding chaperone